MLWGKDSSSNALPLTSSFVQYKDYREYGISSKSLYSPENANGHASGQSYCQMCASLLDAISNGGRIGFDVSYISRGKQFSLSIISPQTDSDGQTDCSHNRYTTAQICSILEKFDRTIFIGDKSTSKMYAGFNLLLRQNLAYSSLEHLDMTEKQIWIAAVNCSSPWVPACLIGSAQAQTRPLLSRTTPRESQAATRVPIVSFILFLQV